MLEFDIRDRDVPEVHRTQFNKSLGAIDLLVDAGAIGFTYDWLSSANASRLLKYHQERLKLGEFSLPSLDKPAFGYSGVLQTEKLASDQFLVRCLIPSTNQDPLKGKHVMREVITSLEVFYETLGFYEGIAKSDRIQLMHSKLSIGDFLESYISVVMAKKMSEWIIKQPVKSLKDVELLMSEVFDCVIERKVGETRPFRARLERERGLSLECFGDCCCLTAQYDEIDANKGFLLAPHNIDGSSQILSMLIGVSKICDIAQSSFKLDS